MPELTLYAAFSLPHQQTRETMEDTEIGTEVQTEPQEEIQDEIQEAPKAPYVPKNEWEKEALPRGWKPESEWTGPKEDFVPARFFVEKGKFIGEVMALRRQQEQHAKTVQEIKEHFEKTNAAKLKRELEEIKNKKWQALENGDITAARAAEEQYETMRAQPAQPVQSQNALEDAVRAMDPEYDTITNTPHFDQWLTSNPAAYNAWQMARVPQDGITILNQYREAFKPREAKPPPSPVSSPARGRAQAEPDGKKFADLDHETQSRFREWARMGAYTNDAKGRAEYVQGLIDAGEL